MRLTSDGAADWSVFCLGKYFVPELVGTALRVAIDLSLVILVFGEGSPVIRSFAQGRVQALCGEARTQ
jgi:hypothetical protein